jgi:hypothetical protein
VPAQNNSLSRAARGEASRDLIKLLQVRTARFAVVVETCGVPQVYTLWQSPKEDRRLQTRIRLARIMSLQRTASWTAFGCVGFIERKGAMYLEFPKSLKRFADQRIVGIKWELVKK